MRFLFAALLSACSSTTVLYGETGDASPDAARDGSTAEALSEDAAPDPCAACASTEWFCAGYVCESRNCFVCETAGCRTPPGCSELGTTFTFYTVSCCP